MGLPLWGFWILGVKGIGFCILGFRASGFRIFVLISFFV